LCGLIECFIRIDDSYKDDFTETRKYLKWLLPKNNLLHHFDCPFNLWTCHSYK